MNGHIYIAGVFQTVNRSACGRKGAWVDNDPHFWTSPPTWGICRNDIRARAKQGDVIFFVLPRRCRHPQMIFGYLTIAEIVTHAEAFKRPDLRSKRMGPKIPNGNIIVDANGGYNRYDDNAHLHKFQKIRHHYAIGTEAGSRMLTHEEIRRKAPTFLTTLSAILNRRGTRPFDVISRAGQKLDEKQVKDLISWLNS